MNDELEISMKYILVFLTIFGVVGTTYSQENPQSINKEGTAMSDTAKNVATLEVVVTRVFDAPVGEVWKAWTDPQYVMRWWGPQGYTSPVAKIDFREGGKSLVCMRSPDGQEMYSTWTYRKIVPNERIEYIFNFADEKGNRLDPAAIGMPSGIPIDGHHVVTFKDLGSDKTEMTITEHGYTNEQVVQLSKAGLEQCVDKMNAIFVTP
jgi:uncharacterized protein YndB with AHSA1/START domain